MSLERHAFITGISSSIGGTIARRFLSQNWNVLGTHYRHKQNIPEGCRSVSIDFRSTKTTYDQMRSFLRNHAQGRLDIVVHAAGNLRDSSLLTMSEEDWKSVRQVHLDTAFHLARVCNEYFVREEELSAHFIVISSLVGIRGGYGQSNYSAANAGLLGFLYSLAQEWAPRILVNAVQPPLTRSHMTDSTPEGNLRKHQSKSPIDNPSEPNQTAELVNYLVHQDTITGQVLSADNRIHGLVR